MKKSKVLQSIIIVAASLLPFGIARAALPGSGNLVLFEDLPAAFRGSAMTQVNAYLSSHPAADPKLVYFAFDQTGTLYIIDRSSARVQLVGQPSSFGHDAR